MQAMTAPWLDSVTPVGPPTAANPSVRQLLYAAAVTGGWSGLVCLLLYAVGRLVGVPFEVVRQAGEQPMVVPWFAVLLLPLVVAAVFALLSALVRGVRHAGRIVFWVGTVLAVASLWAPLGQPDGVAWSSRVLLALMHAITWLLVVPQIARIVGDSEPGHSVERRG